MDRFFVASGVFTWLICRSPEVNLDLVPLILSAITLKICSANTEISLEIKDKNLYCSSANISSRHIKKNLINTS